MKAIVYRKYGSPEVLRLSEVDKPTIDENGVLVRVHAASLNPLDWRLMSGKPVAMRLMLGVLKPKRSIPGVDVAGIVEEVGKNVTQFKPGDEVFGHRSAACAEYVVGEERHFAPKPNGLTLEQAAAIPVAGLSALQALRDKGRVQPGQRVLINGASGGVGTFTVQIAKALGAVVTGVCSTGKVELVRGLGADEVIDYTQQDFTRTGDRYDLIIDNAASRSLADLRRALIPEGIVVGVGAPHHFTVTGLIFQMLKAAVWSKLGKQKFLSMLANPNQPDLLLLKEMAESGKLTPIIDRTYPLSETPQALEYLEQGHASGKVVIRVTRTD